jgi:hypothetical protein
MPVFRLEVDISIRIGIEFSEFNNQSNLLEYQRRNFGVLSDGKREAVSGKFYTLYFKPQMPVFRLGVGIEFQ